MKKDNNNSLVFENTFGISLNFTFTKGGYIISIKPIASGMLLVPCEKELMNSELEGIKYPMDTPAAIARKIHRVRYLSRNPSRLRLEITPECLFSI